jgi:hypothetical protein
MNLTDCFVFDLRPDQRPTKPLASRATEGRGPACDSKDTVGAVQEDKLRWAPTPKIPMTHDA